MSDTAFFLPFCLTLFPQSIRATSMIALHPDDLLFLHRFDPPLAQCTVVGQRITHHDKPPLFCLKSVPVFWGENLLNFPSYFSAIFALSLTSLLPKAGAVSTTTLEAGSAVMVPPIPTGRREASSHETASPKSTPIQAIFSKDRARRKSFILQVLGLSHQKEKGNFCHREGKSCLAE